MLALGLLAAISFTAPRTFASGIPGNAILTADLNRDGVPDVIVHAAGVSVMLGSPDGTLGPPTVLLFTRGDGVAVADFNGDGRLDLAATAEGQIVVFPGRGDGTFGAPITSPSDTFRFAMTVADFNGDGRLDLAAANADRGTVAVVLGRGDGSFALPANYAVDLLPIVVVAGDFDRDHHPDLAVQTANRIDVLMNAGDGTMRPFSTVANAAPNLSLGTADLNGDGAPDLAFGAPERASVALLLGRGDGTFASGALPLSGTLQAVTIADVDGNATPDLIVKTESLGASFHEIYANDGAGLWRRAGTPFAVGTPAVADLDHDGTPDLILARSAGSTVAVMHGLAFPVLQGEFKAAAGQLRGHAVAAADVTGDGKIDLIATNNDDTFSVFNGNGDGTFQFPVSHAVTAPSAVRTADVNGDGKPDVVIVQAQAVSVFVNQGGGVFAALVVIPIGEIVNDVKATDVNGDGRADLIITGLNGVRIAMSRADGTFRTDVVLGVGAPAISSAVADFDGDGRIDVAVFPLTPTGDNPRFFKGAGNGTFTPGHSTSWPTPGFVSATGDLNGDGIADIVTTYSNGSSATAWIGLGDGRFSPRDFTTATSATAVAIEDIDGDGYADVVMTNRTAGEVTVYPGRGDGTLAAPVSFAAVPLANSLGIGDFNGDGKADIATAGAQDNAIAVLINESVPVPKRRRASRAH